MTMIKRVPMFFVLAGLVCLAIGVSSSRGADAPAGKLVIVKAVYGDLPDGAKTDVTEKVKEMVKDNALSVEASNDNFGDPADGIVKKLKVDYTIGGVAASKTVNEGETLTIAAGEKPVASKLVIKKAVYGDLPDGAKKDVTEKVAAMVKDGALSVEATNENFGDPAEGVVKKLKVDYTFDGKEKSKTV
ncbi:MAG: DNAJC11 domain-containing protein, partial [Tepidisphaerales bacterium]